MSITVRYFHRFNFSLFSFFELSFIECEITIFSFQREIIIISLFSKQTLVSTNNLKIPINIISGWLEMCKNIIFA